MRSFRVTNVEAPEFCRKVEAEIRARNFQDIAALRLDGDRLRVAFSWMGRSTLDYELREIPGGFDAILQRERMSPMHRGFKRGFEERFESILGAVGAEIL